MSKQKKPAKSALDLLEKRIIANLWEKSRPNYRVDKSLMVIKKIKVEKRNPWF